MAKPLKVPASFYSDLRDPGDLEHEEIMKAVSEETCFRSKFTKIQLLMCFICVFYLWYFFMSSSVFVKILCVCVIAVTALGIGLFLYRRNLWIRVKRSIGSKDYIVKVAKCCIPVTNGSKSTVTLRVGEGVSVVVPSLYKPTETLYNKGIEEFYAIVAIVGKVGRLIVIPTEVKYEYV